MLVVCWPGSMMSVCLSVVQRRVSTGAMPHGDFSDVSALLFAVTGAASIYAPQVYFAKASFLEIHPMLEIHAMFEAEPTPELLNARAAPHPSCANPHPNPDLNPYGQP